MNATKLNWIIPPILKGNDFKCGICRRYLVLPPIYSCDSVKFICGLCYGAQRYYYGPRNVPEEDNIQRQTLYETFASIMEFPCSNDGCNIYSRFGGYARVHEELCDYLAFQCPISIANRWFLKPQENVCEWQSTDQSEMVLHIKKYHSDYILTPHKIRMMDLITSTEHVKMFIIILSDDLIAVLRTEFIPPRTQTFKCRVNRHRHKWIDYYKCKIEIEPELYVSEAPKTEFFCMSIDSYEYEEDENIVMLNQKKLQRCTLKFSFKHPRKNAYSPTYAFRCTSRDSPPVSPRKEISENAQYSSASTSQECAMSLSFDHFAPRAIDRQGTSRAIIEAKSHSTEDRYSPEPDEFILL